MKGKRAVERIAAGRLGDARRLEAKKGISGIPLSSLGAMHWYAMMVKAGVEEVVASNIEGIDGIVALVPKRREWRKVNRYSEKKHPVDYPLLPRYVFVGFGAVMSGSFEDEVRFFFELQRELTLVQSMVGIDGLPVRMDAIKVAKFLRTIGLIKAPDWERHMPTHGEFGPGDTVEIISGSFVGHRVQVHQISGAVAEVLMPLFGVAEQKVRVPLANLEKAD